MEFKYIYIHIYLYVIKVEQHVIEKPNILRI